MNLTFISLAIALATVECVDREKLGSTPSPQKKFDVNRYMGDWYLQARMPPCSWAGSYGFTNVVSQYSKQSTGIIHIKGSWRSTDCSGATFKYTPQNIMGVFVLKDPIGDMFSGINVVVATDYENVAINWGCTKYNVDGTCGDPYVGVKTRMKDPSPYTWKVIEAILNHHWKLSISEMIRTVHDNDACVHFKEPVLPYGPGHGVEHLMKTY